MFRRTALPLDIHLDIRDANSFAVQGKVYHWTMSCGFSMADAVNYMASHGDAHPGSLLRENCERFAQDHAGIRNRDGLARIYKQQRRS